MSKALRAGRTSVRPVFSKGSAAGTVFGKDRIVLLVRALYYSFANSREDVDAVLDAARHNNAQLNITGALICDRGRYLQVLEGARPAVSALLMRIAADPRHASMTLADFAEIDARRFDGFAMAFADADASFQSMRLTDFDTAPVEALYRQIEHYLEQARAAA